MWNPHVLKERNLEKWKSGLGLSMASQLRRSVPATSSSPLSILSCLCSVTDFWVSFSFCEITFRKGI